MTKILRSSSSLGSDSFSPTPYSSMENISLIANSCESSDEDVTAQEIHELSLFIIKNANPGELYDNETAKDTATEIRNLNLIDAENPSKTSTKLTQAFTKIKRIEILQICGKKLTTVPNYIGYLTELKKLDLRANDLQMLPESISKLSNLRELNICGNQNFQELPRFLDPMTSIRKILISNTRIRQASAALVDRIHPANNIVYWIPRTQ